MAKLVQGDLLQVRKQGRHKYFQLFDHQVAALLEQLLTLTWHRQPLELRSAPLDPRLRHARRCYDHLAGITGVALHDALVRSGHLCQQAQESRLSDKGRDFFQNLGVDFEALSTRRRPLCKACLDWSERRDHLAGALGHWILEDILRMGWAKRDLDSRIIRFSHLGGKAFSQRYQIPVSVFTLG